MLGVFGAASDSANFSGLIMYVSAVSTEIRRILILTFFLYRVSVFLRPVVQVSISFSVYFLRVQV
jgi:hypothetical protein